MVADRWLDAFAAGVSEANLGKYVLADGNYLWHIFSWKLVPCLEGDAARNALAELPDETFYLFYKEYPPADTPLVRAVSKEDAIALAGRSDVESPLFDGSDCYLVDKDFTWTYVHTHEEACGPYFCKMES